MNTENTTETTEAVADVAATTAPVKKGRKAAPKVVADTPSEATQTVETTEPVVTPTETEEAAPEAALKASSIALDKANAKAEKARLAELAKVEKAEAKAAAKAAAKAMAEEAKRLEAATKEANKAPTFEGYEIAADADVAFIANEVAAVTASLTEITSKDQALVGHYLTLGEFQSRVAPMFKSTKVYGQFLKDKLPQSQALDAALRSNCKWLYENSTEVVRVLKVNRLEDFKSGNPSVIRAEYRKALDAAKVSEAAAEAGTTEEELVKAEKANAKAAKIAAKEAETKTIEEGLVALAAAIIAAKRLAPAADVAVKAIRTMLMQDDRAGMVAYLATFAEEESDEEDAA